MPKVSVNILTKDRPQQLKRALASVRSQTFTDYEVVVVDDGSTDNTELVLKDLKFKDLKIIHHPKSLGITVSRQEALLAGRGEYIAVLDDDDEWIDADKLKKQAEYLDAHKDAILTGGGVQIERLKDLKIEKFRPETYAEIRRTMLLRNNFFTSTVMFRREAAIKAGGFIKDNTDLAEDYDLWLRLGKLGKMYNFQEAFTLYAKPNYNKDKFQRFLGKQLNLIGQHKHDYPGYIFASLILRLRLFVN